MFKYKSTLSGVLCASVLMTVQAFAAEYVLTATNISDGNSDQVIVDNTGALVASNAIASLGYFKTITDPSSKSIATLINDFQPLVSSNFAEQGSSYKGLFDCNITIKNAESSQIVTSGRGKSLYLFIGNATNLTSASYIGLVKTDQLVRDLSVAQPVYNTAVDYSAGKFAKAGTILYGNITTDSVNWDSGNSSHNSTGTFKLVAVPEPSSLALLGLGMVGFVLRRRR